MASSTWYQQILSTTKLHHRHLPISLSKPRKVKEFVVDLTIISASSSDHSEALKTISRSCNNLDLSLKPSKCISFVYDGKKMNKSATFIVSSGFTRYITSGPTNFLGLLQTSSYRSKSCETGKKFIGIFQHKEEILDHVHVHGKYKLWVYKSYLVASFHFVMAVDPIPESAIRKCRHLLSRSG